MRQGRVTVNGAVACLGQQADGENDVICVDGKELRFTQDHTYLMLHKPRGYVCSLADCHAEHLVTELVADCGARVYPVGRLDQDSEGLLLMTDDGDFMEAVTHPRRRVDKVYEVTVSGALEDCAQRLAAVRELDGAPIVPAQVELLGGGDTTALLRVTIHQGKNRQIRRMCAKAGLTVVRLKRVAEDKLLLGDLPCGKWRYLTPEERDYFKGSDKA